LDFKLERATALSRRNLRSRKFEKVVVVQIRAIFNQAVPAGTQALLKEHKLYRSYMNKDEAITLLL